MSGIRELKRRIKSISSTEQMTKAMKMVAVSKYNKALLKMQDFKPFSKQCTRLLNQLAGDIEGSPLAENRPVNKICYVAVTGNRGLCGSYNMDLFRKLIAMLKEENREYTIVMCGKWGAGHYQSSKIEGVSKVFEVDDIPTYAQAVEISEYLRDLFLSGEADEICFVYQAFKNILTQTPVTKVFLPFQREEKPDGGDAGAGTEYLFVPDRESILGDLVVRCLNTEVYRILLDMAVGANGSMMMAMRNASENSSTMIADLSLTLNRMRQNSVTTEVLEIASGTVAKEEEEK